MNLSISEVIIISLVILALLITITLLVGYIFKSRSDNLYYIVKNKNPKEIDLILKEDTKKLFVEVESNRLLVNFLKEFGISIGEMLLKQNQEVINENSKTISHVIEQNKSEADRNFEKHAENNKFLDNVRGALKKFAEPLEDLVSNDTQYQEAFKKIHEEITKYYDIIEGKNKEIETYKKGYEYSINKRTIMNILSVMEAIQLNESYDEAIIDGLTSLIETNVLRQMNVFKIDVKIGDTVDPKIMFVSGDSDLAKEKSEIEKVYKIISNGYQLQEGNVINIIKEAKVLAYKRG